MTRVVVSSKIGSDGILHLDLPFHASDADKEVRVTVEPMGPRTWTVEEWRRMTFETAGKWQGEFERPEQGELQEREPLS